jgi:hypothetical protein
MMKKITKVKKIRWDPIIVKLADNKVKQKFCANTNKQYTTSKNQINEVIMSKKRLSKEDFEVFLKSLFANDTLPFKYQNPDAWRVHKLKKKNNSS